jgi:hypothetical protein
MPTLPTPVLYRGGELLTIRPYATAVNDRREVLSAIDAGAKGVHGASVPSVADAPAGETRTIAFDVTSRAQLAALEAFLARRSGRRVGCWVPTFRHDATVTADGVAVRSDYVTAFARLAAERGGRDHWAALLRNGTMQTASLTSVTDTGDGTMALPFSGFAGAGTTAGGTCFSRLEWVRLAGDEITTTYRNGHVATIAIDLVTIPRETP